MEVGFDLGDIVLDGDQAPPSPKIWYNSLPFSAHVYCRQTAGWTMMPLGTEAGLGTGHIVLYVDAASSFPKRGRAPSPNFRHVRFGQTAG